MDFDKANYVTERLWAPASDGAKVPISIVYRKGLGEGRLGAAAALRLRLLRLQHGRRLRPHTGCRFSIEASSTPSPTFAAARRWAAHWYESGKLLKKKNTFTDFIDCGRYLVAEGYTTPRTLFAMGGSAGGLLMGAVTNMAPELFAGIVSRVPFVDVVTTMLDPDIPLTTSEYDEWGNPNEKQYYDYMLSYSPYDQMEEPRPTRTCW